jgi:outer membrane protein assembly factor BamA
MTSSVCARTKKRLRRFYYSRGYADFQVISASAS